MDVLLYYYYIETFCLKERVGAGREGQLREEEVWEMNSEQIEATAGGELLRQEAASFTQVKNTEKSSQRLHLH